MSQTNQDDEPLHGAAGSAANGEPPPDVEDIPAAHKFMLVATDTLGLIKNTLDLAALELLAAAKAVPKLIALSLGLVFFLSLAWISFSVCMSWLAYTLFGTMGAAFFCFLLIQLLVIGILIIMMKRCQRALRMPNTQAQAKEIAEVFNEAFKTRKAQTNGGD